MAHILIVDDEKSIRRTLAEFLREEGHKVVEAEDAEVALQRLRESDYDVVVTDIILPRVTGVELLRRIHATAPHVQVVMMTGEPTVETATESLRMGAVDYLFKPITKAAILRVVSNAARIKSLDDTKRRLEAENEAYREKLERLVEERTEQLRASEAAAQELSRFNQSILDALTAHICVLAEDGTILAANRAWLNVAGDNPLASSKTGVGGSYLSVCEAVAEAREVARGLQGVAKGEKQEFELEYACHSPEAQRWFVLRVTRFAGEGPARMVVAHENITARKQAEAVREALLSLGARLSSATSAAEVARSIFATADGFWRWDAGTVDVSWPGQEQARSVLSLDVIDGERREVPPAGIRDKATPRVRRVMERGGELMLRTPEEMARCEDLRFGDTQRVSASILCVPIHRRNESVGVLSIQSYTLNAFKPADLQILQALADYCGGALERIQVEEQLREQAALLDAANDAIHVRELDGIVRFWNKGAERLLGWTRAEAVGHKITDLIPYEAESFETAMVATLKQGSWSGELRETSKLGKQLTVFCHWTLLRDERGEPKEILAIGTDITEKKQMETNFLRAQRLEGIGALASGIAHDLNNILAPVLMIAPLLRETISDEDSRSMLETIESCARRGADIVKQLLTFARGKPGARAPLPVRHLLRDLDKIIRETFPRDISPRVETSKDLWPLLGDATQVHQALMNLCVNARDAMPDGGTLTLEAKNVNVDEAFATRTPGARPGPHVCVSVSDTGTGIAPEHLDRIFDPFFTTKEIGKGNGLGLATVLGIVRGHEGFVRMSTLEGKGTTFDLYFPAVPQAAPPNSPAPEAPVPHGHGELILVVDDEAAVRDGLRRTLEVHGYQVVTATQGAEGLTVFAQHKKNVRAVLTDMMMPVMNGPNMITALRHIEPQLVILGMTGLPERNGIKGLEGLELAALLTKPFNGEELLRVLPGLLRPPVADLTP
jgi:PAS domain S-box-containing protein